MTITKTTNIKPLEIQQSSVDQDLFSRQLYIFDMTSMTNIQSTNLILIGLENTALEILKNVVLAGLINIELYDPRIITESDLSYGFYITKLDIGKRRDIVYKKILEENILQSLNVNIYTNYKEYDLITIKKILKVQHICLLNEGIIQLNEDINKYCRIKGIKFIGVKTRGFFSFVFNDLIEFVSNDINGEPLITGYAIWNSNILDITEKKNFIIGMKLKLINEINNNEEEVSIIEIISPLQIKINKSIENETSISFEEIKEKKLFSFNSLTDILINKNLFKKILCEPWELEVKEFLLKLFRVECIFFNKYSSLIEIKDKEELIKILKDKFNMIPNKNQLNIINWFLRSNNSIFYPLLSVVGGFVAQEILKAASKKYSPLNQIWLYECFTNSFETILSLQEDLNKEEIMNKEVIINKDINKRVKLLSNLIGESNVNIINKTLSPFIIGAGAIGCELLKNLAMLNISSVKITDSDSVELSNLSRQFLFNKSDIRKMKSEAVKRSLKIINEDMKIISYTKLIQDKEFDTNNFMNKISLFANALDNLEARQYVDTLSIKYGISLFDAGTLGTKGSTFCSIKGITENWGAQQDPKETSIPVCTLRSFPSNSTHSIEFGLDEFKMFNEHLNTKKKTIERIIKTNKFEIPELLNILSFPVTKQLVVFCSLKWFTELFYSNIEILKSTYPKDYKNSDGTPFWNSLKRYPISIIFNYNNNIHKMCLLSMCNVFLQCNIINNKVMNMEELENILINYNKNNNNNIINKYIQLEKKESKIININNYNKEICNDLKEILQFLEINNIINHLNLYNNLIPQSLEKDNDFNYHINLIHHISILRCNNYRIKEPNNFLFTKGIAGRIIPAISTTTGMISGLITIEMIKYILYISISKEYNIEIENLNEFIINNKIKNKFDIKDSFNNSFIELSQPWIGGSNPLLAKVFKTISGSSTIWTNIVFKLTYKETLIDFINKFENKYNYKIGDLMLNGDLIFSTILISEERTCFLNKPLYQVCTIKGIIDSIIYLEVVLDEDDDIEVSNVKVVFID